MSVDRYKNLVMTRCVYNTVQTSSSARMSFPGTLHEAVQIPKSGEGLHPFEPRLKGGHPPLKSPLCVRFSSQARRKTAGFFTFLYSSIRLNFTIIILTLFAQVMVSEASATNYDA